LQVGSPASRAPHAATADAGDGPILCNIPQNKWEKFLDRHIFLNRRY